MPHVEDVLDPVEDGTMCVLACYETDIEAVICTAGAWSPHPPGEAACHLCPPLSVPSHAVMTCSEAYIGANTTCSLECESEDLYLLHRRVGILVWRGRGVAGAGRGHHLLMPDQAHRGECVGGGRDPLL